jgi:hypothetical protein
MVDEHEARRIAEQFILEKWGVPQTAERVTFRDAATRRRRITTLASRDDAETTEELIANCRDKWSVMFPTVMQDGSVLDDQTFVDVDAVTGDAVFFE